MVQVSVRFELAKVRVIGSQLYLSIASNAFVVAITSIMLLNVIAHVLQLNLLYEFLASKNILICDLTLTYINNLYLRLIIE